MGISSAAEAKLEASIRPEITVMRARTSYPRRHRPGLAALPGGQSDTAARALPAGQAGPAADAGNAAGPTGEPRPGEGAATGSTPGVRLLAPEAATPALGAARVFRSASFTSARTVRTATSAVASARTTRPGAAGRRAARPSGPARSAWNATAPAGGGAARRSRPELGGAGRVGSEPGAADRTGPLPGVAGRGLRAGADASRRVAVPGPIRLTRRGRFVVGLLAGLAIAGAAALIWFAVTGQAQAASKVTPVPARAHSMIRVVVRPGQTLWGIAAKADPSADPRIVIQQIMNDNALSGTAVNAGQVLWVPRV